MADGDKQNGRDPRGTKQEARPVTVEPPLAPETPPPAPAPEPRVAAACVPPRRPDPVAACVEALETGRITRAQAQAILWDCDLGPGRTGPGAGASLGRTAIFSGGALAGCSESLGRLAAALAAAQAVIRLATKDRTNPHFGSDYATLGATIDACREALSAHRLAVIQPVAAEGKRVVVTTLLVHESGEWVRTDLALEARDAGPQSVGSAITYGRRYGLAALVGVAPDEDDDGEGATHAVPAAPWKRGGAAKPAAGAAAAKDAKEWGAQIDAASELAVLRAIADACPESLREQLRPRYKARWKVLEALDATRVAQGEVPDWKAPAAAMASTPAAPREPGAEG